jgi:hypothetical protein
VFDMGLEQADMLKEHVKAEYEKAMDTFDDAPKDDKDFFKVFSFICLLSLDVYIKKEMIEQLIDELDKTLNEEN